MKVLPSNILILVFIIYSLDAQNADFHDERVLKTVTFGSCKQVLWNN